MVSGVIEAMAGQLTSYWPNILRILLVLVGAKITLMFIKLISKKVVKAFNIPRAYFHPVRQLLTALVYVIATILVLTSIPGMNQTVLGILSVFAGVVVSLSSTSTLGNAIAGLIIIVARPIKEGDRIKVNEVMGDVVSTELLFVHIKTIKNEIISMPALQVLTSQILNYSVIDDLIVHVDVGIGYDTDLKKAENLMLEAAKETEHTSKEKEPFLLVKDLEDHKIVYEVNVYTDEPVKYVLIASELRRNVLRKFSESTVELASPLKVDTRTKGEKIVTKGVKKEKTGSEGVSEAEEQKEREEAKKEIEERRKQEK